ncbi:MAG: hypothetical protein MZU91_02870 [Desulfosudis oleivorans]|nr:hypothetical protein [Desulfosudis oleivorans]
MDADTAELLHVEQTVLDPEFVPAVLGAGSAQSCDPGRSSCAHQDAAGGTEIHERSTRRRDTRGGKDWGATSVR